MSARRLLHTLEAGDKFRLPGRAGVILIEYQHPNLADYPEGHLEVVPVAD